MSIILKPGINVDILIPMAALCGTDEADFYEFAARYPDLTIERDVDGCIILEPPVHFQTGEFESEANGELLIWNRRCRLGKVFASTTGFVLPNGAMRCPDAAWISNERIAALPKEEWHRFARICPDFVLEIRSDTDGLRPLMAKMEEYIANGARLGFLIDPSEPRAYVYRPGEAVKQTGSFDTVLTGDPELPGFALPLELFKGAL